MGRAAAKEPARRRVIQAALRTLTEVGYGATTARSIARTGGFAPGVIYYHFDSIEDVMLAALDETSEARLAAYRVALAGVGGAGDMVERLSRLYAEDMAAGHIAAIQEMVAGASSSPELGAEIVKRIAPWLAFTEEVVRAFLAGSPFESMLPARDLAFAAVSVYLGMETLSHLDGDRSRAESLFDSARKLTPLLDMLLRPGVDG
jgi:AcrR family transcriptional regulator